MATYRGPILISCPEVPASRFSKQPAGGKSDWLERHARGELARQALNEVLPEFLEGGTDGEPEQYYGIEPTLDAKSSVLANVVRLSCRIDYVANDKVAYSVLMFNEDEPRFFELLPEGPHPEDYAEYNSGIIVVNRSTQPDQDGFVEAEGIYYDEDDAIRYGDIEAARALVEKLVQPVSAQ